jgi:hypothetical protein
MRKKLNLTSIVCLFVLGYHQRVIIAMEKEVPTTYLSLTINHDARKNNSICKKIMIISIL